MSAAAQPPAPPPVWRGYDQAALDAQYDNHAAAGPAGAVALSRLRGLAHRNRDALPIRANLAYGPHPAMRLDLYPVEGVDGPQPCLVLVHGGGWTAGNAAGAAFWAARLREWGVSHAVVSHARRPEATLAEMAAQVAQAWRFLRHEAGPLGLDPARMHLAGLSSGATLAALAAIALRDEAPPASLLLMGGMYEMEPVRLSFRNALLSLSPADAAALSVLPRAALLPGPVLVAHGALETAEFRRQARDLAARLGPRGTLMEIAGADHFSQAEALLDPGTPLAQHLHALLTAKPATESPR